MGKVEQSIEVNAPVGVCYDVWTDFKNFPKFMKHVESVTQKGDTQTNVWHWIVNGPMGKKVEWDAEVDAQQPNQTVSWHSVRNAEVQNSGAVTFEVLSPTRTRVNAVIAYEPPAGVLGEAVAALFSNPTAMVKEDLENFRQIVEVEDSARQIPVGAGIGTAL